TNVSLMDMIPCALYITIATSMEMVTDNNTDLEPEPCPRAVITLLPRDRSGFISDHPVYNNITGMAAIMVTMGMTIFSALASTPGAFSVSRISLLIIGVAFSQSTCPF